MNDRESAGSEVVVPDGIDLEEAYAAVRYWLQTEILKEPKDRKPPRDGDWDYVHDYVLALSPSKMANEDEMLELLHKVGTSDLEFACGGFDGRCTIFAYYRAFERRIRKWESMRLDA